MAEKRKPGILDRSLLVATVSLLVTGAATAFLGVYKLVEVIF